MSGPLETYEQAIEYLFGRINYERAHADSYAAQDLKLDRMRELLRRLGDPQLRIPAVHVAGTKGKGSTCSMLASVLTAAGWRTGLYTSPHLTRFEERMTVDGACPASDTLVDLVNRVSGATAEMDRLPTAMHPTYFEIATALAWLHFLDRQVEIAVLETGLGGRLDSTNLCRPWATIVTNVSRDHTHILGSTVREIAREKAGIIKPGVPVVTGVEHPEAIEAVSAAAAQAPAPLLRLGRDFTWTAASPDGATIDVITRQRTWRNIPLPLRGAHQATNAALVVAVLEQLQPQGVTITDEVLAEGLQRVHWPGRIEVVGRKPTVVLDAAHNWESAKALVRVLRHDFPARRRVLVFATTRDKDYRGLVRQLLPEFDTVILTRYVDNPRGIPPEELAEYVQAISDRPVHLAADPCLAWRLARRWAHADDLVVITGSFFLVGELRELVIEECRSAHDVAQPVAT